MPHTAFYSTLTDTERANIEQTSFNFFTARGSNMKVPPTLYEELKRGGVNMKYIDADASLEN